jgi:hypothetical protein
MNENSNTKQVCIAEDKAAMNWLGPVEQAKAVVEKFPDEWDPNELMAALDFLREAVKFAVLYRQ